MHIHSQYCDRTDHGGVFKWTINLVSDVSGILETSWMADIQVVTM